MTNEPAILALVQSLAEDLRSARTALDGRLTLIEHRWDEQWHDLSHDVSMMRGELSETREAVAGLRDHMARDATMVQRHLDEASRMIRSLENAYDGLEDREEKAAAFAKGREAERYRYVQFARVVGRVVTHRAFLIVLASLAALGVSVINALRWWGW